VFLENENPFHVFKDYLLSFGMELFQGSFHAL